MKIQWKRLLSLCLTVMLLVCALPAIAEQTDELAEWTVMLYLCGTDLESERMAATVNLGEIFDTASSDGVNLLIQTGGAEAWHTQEVFDGWEIASDKLQRYYYRDETIRLVDEQPLANMANAQTLTDFINWSVEVAPAKKYALVLWDHGGGSYSGIIVDELHNDSIMQVEDLSRALRDSGATFEAIITDACLMATLEVSQALAPYARYLIASEETVPGQGGPFTAWLQYLYDTPTCDGAALGKVYGEAIMEKYAAISETLQATVTYSTIDLSKIDAVGAAFDTMFTEIRAALSDPLLFNYFGYDTQHAQTFDGTLYDLADMAKRSSNSVLSPSTAEAVVNAVNDAVVSNVHGSKQTGANGLSFYYAPQDDVEHMDHFARVCKSAPYLAFLDMVSMAWTAPEWVYEQVERLPDVSRADYTVVADAAIGEDGLPTLSLSSGYNATATVDVNLYQYDKKEKAYRVLGTDVNVPGSFEDGVFHYAFDGQWLALNDRFCQLGVKDELQTMTLYQIPFTTETTMDEFMQTDYHYDFRVGYVYDTGAETLSTDPDTLLTGTYTLYGVWNHTTTSSDLPDRDVWDAAEFDDEKLRLIQYEANVYTGQVTSCLIGPEFTYRSDKFTFEEKALPSGTYAMVFVYKDVFGNVQRSIPFEITWNAKKKTATYAVME